MIDEKLTCIRNLAMEAVVNLMLGQWEPTNNQRLMWTYQDLFED